MKTARFFCIVYLVLAVFGLLYAVKVEEVPSIIIGVFAVGILSIMLFLLTTIIEEKRGPQIVQDREGYTKIGVFQYFEHPKQCQHTVAHSLTLNNDYVVDDDRLMICPGCADNEMRWPSHGDAYTCDKCCTSFQLYGNSVYFWF